jgi:hypothetical protein
MGRLENEQHSEARIGAIPLSEYSLSYSIIGSCHELMYSTVLIQGLKIRNIRRLDLYQIIMVHRFLDSIQCIVCMPIHRILIHALVIRYEKDQVNFFREQIMQWSKLLPN